MESSSPEIAKRYEDMARKYANAEILGPINVLWIHYFINGNNAEAEKIYKEFLSSTTRLMFHRIVQVAREKVDAGLIQKLITVLQNGTAISEGAIGNCYSALLDIQATQNDASLLLDTLKKAIDSVCLENINATALNRAKETIEKAGKSFPYKIPDKKAKKQESSSSSSSSSSSDDDVREKKA